LDGLSNLSIILFYIFLISILIFSVLMRDILKNIKKMKNDIEKVRKSIPILKQAFWLAKQENERDYERYRKLMKRYEALVDSILQFRPTIGVEKFMGGILKLGVKLIAEADAGSVILREGDSARFVSVEGMNEEIIKDLKLELDWFKKPKHDVEVYENILGHDEKSTMPIEVEELMKKAAGRWIYRTMGGRLQVADDTVGYIFLDTMEDREFSEESKKIMKFLVRLSNAYLTLKTLLEKESILQRDIVLSMVKMLEMRDPYTKGHSERVARYSARIANLLGLSGDEIDRIYWAGILHDVGKLGVPDAVLNKPGKLEPEEFEMIKMHSIYGEKAVMKSKYLKDLAPAIRHHHERWDGNGYPDGLKGEEIPLFSRILAISDAFDAMTSARIYRDPMDPSDAFGEIQIQAGKQFDPYIVEKLSLSTFLMEADVFI